MITSRAERVLWCANAALICWLVVAWSISLYCGPIDRNAGFYLPAARMVSEGLVPSVDFWNPYTPGGYYLYALLGERGLSSPLLCKLVTHATLAAFGVLIYATLTRLGQQLSLAVFFAAVFSVWIYSIGSWAVASIDVLQALLVLLSFYCLCRWNGWQGAAVAGLVAGCSLMTKQYAVLSLPWLALFALADYPAQSNVGEASVAGWNWRRCLAFVALVGAPFLLFTAVARQNPIELGQYFATWGGRATSHGWSHGLDAIAKNLTNSSATSMIIVAGVMAVALLALRRSWLHLILAGLFLAGTFPLLVREFAGYAVHAAPWAIMIAAMLCHELSAFFSDRRLANTVLALAACLPLLQITGMGTLLQARMAATNTLGRQQQLAEAIQREIPSRENVFVINSWWLYYLADLQAPLRDYNQLDRPNIDIMAAARDAAEYIVYCHEKDKTLSHEDVTAWIAEPGYFVRQTRFDWHGQPIEIYARAQRDTMAPTVAPPTTPTAQAE